MRITRLLQTGAILIGVACSAFALAETPADFLRQFEAVARQESVGFLGFSPQRGDNFFHTTHGREWSCATCHTQNPSVDGKHTKTEKRIAPLAPTANAERFTRPDKVEKWFKRNCNDVLGRACSAQEKGDVLAYLIAQKK